jgi:hypothetical protein
MSERCSRSGYLLLKLSEHLFDGDRRDFSVSAGRMSLRIRPFNPIGEQIAKLLELEPWTSSGR